MSGSGVLLTWCAKLTLNGAMAPLYMQIGSDSALKQILLSMNEKQSFIIEDLDDFHVVIKADEEYRVRQEVEAEVRGPLSCNEYKCA